MQWFKSEILDPVRQEPIVGYHLFVNPEQAQLWKEQMEIANPTVSIRIIGPANRDELLKFVKDNNLRLTPDQLSNAHNKRYYLNN